MALILFFEICEHIVHGHIPPSISHMLITSQLLALEKQATNIQPITIGKAIY
jgi:hypothetical protein